MKERKQYAKNYKCCQCKKKKAVAFWPMVDIDIPHHPYCRKCLDEIKQSLLIKMFMANQGYKRGGV